MRRILVVANQTLGGQLLLERLRAYAATGPCAVHVLVPASPARGPGPQPMDAHELGVQLAVQRLDAALHRFAPLGVTVVGEVGGPNAVDAVRDVLRREVFDEIVVSTLPVGMSRWLRLDVVSRIERVVSLPVTHVMAEE